jgi:uncharacterized protein YceK
MRVSRISVLIITLLGCAVSGCGTLSDHGFGPCPKPREGRIYGGVRSDIECVTSGSAGAAAIGVLDLPLSAIADTILLPTALRTPSHKPAEAASTDESK